MRPLLASAVICALSALPAGAAEFASRYTVEGSSPGGGGKYAGSVTVRKTGEATYQVVWTIGDQKYVGTGIGSPDGLAVAYKSGSDTGIAIYREGKGGEIDGYWTYAGGKAIGQESWSPQ